MAGSKSVGRYHTNDSGKTLPCTAGVRECRFVHGSTPSEAAENWQQSMAESLIPEAQSSSESPELKLLRYRSMSLKEMDDRELAESILLECEELGIDTEEMAQAIALASELHGDQFRKGARGSVSNPPYIEHPLRNTLRLIRMGCDDAPTLKGSVLHDTVEDGADVFARRMGWSNRASRNQGLARVELSVHIERSFGRETAEIVLAVTNPLPESDPRLQSTEEKHRIYVDHLRAHVLHSPEAYLVKVSDFIDNATGLYHGVGSMDSEKLKKQATKYLLSIPVFQEGLDRIPLSLPVHSRKLLQDSLIETERRLKRIIDGWDGTGRI